MKMTLQKQIAHSLMLFLCCLILSHGQPVTLRTAFLNENLLGDSVREPQQQQQQQYYKGPLLFLQRQRTVSVTSTCVASPYIVGGQDAEPHEYPYLIRSVSSAPSSLFCTGTLIHIDMIVTAAHCQGTFVDGVLVGAWSANPFSSPVQPQYRQVDGQFRHAGFNENNGMLQDDIMLLRLDWPVENIPLATLNFNTSIPAANDFVTAVGFGLTSEPVDNIWESSSSSSSSSSTATPASIVQKADQMQYWDRTSCKNVLNKAANVVPGEGIMCASADNQSVCSGDSGGPLLWEQQNDDDTTTMLQVGITSFGLGCSSIPIPNGFTRISHYANWITDSICKHSRHAPVDCPLPEPYPPFGKVLVNITFQFDTDVGETTWAIRDQSTGDIAEVGPTDNPPPNSLWWSTIFLEPASSYRLEVYDSYGDGIDDGWYEIWAELQPGVQTMVVPRQKGDFQSMQTTDFEIPSVDASLFGAAEPETAEAPSSLLTVMATHVPTQVPFSSSTGADPAALSFTTAHNVDASGSYQNEGFAFLFILVSFAIQ